MLWTTFSLRRAANAPKETAGAEAINTSFIFEVKRWFQGWCILFEIPYATFPPPATPAPVQHMKSASWEYWPLPSFAHTSWAMAINQLNIEGIPTSSGPRTTLCIC
jgi:hypothetical protein